VAVARRAFLVGAASLAVGAAARQPRLRFSVIGLDHSHINGQTDTMLAAGGELVWVFASAREQLAAFQRRYPQVKAARSEAEILEDPSVALVLSAAIPNERAPLGIRVMQHGKDFMVDKPGMTTLEQLADVRRVQAQTKRIYSVLFGRFENKATIRAGELVKAGAIGNVIQTVGLGPHRLNASSRPPWFFDRPKYGGILCDLASHQGDQFLFFTGSTTAEVVSSQVGNIQHPEFPGLEDFGDATVRGNHGLGYMRVDWFTPGGLTAFGDGRLTILGTNGYIEIRQHVDIAGRPGDSHLFLVDQKEARRIDCSDVELRYGRQVASDIANRNETAMTQRHCFLASEIILKAQQQAQRVTL
jgi:predicted dehydrogenase